MAERLVRVGGVRAVALGGSRARGTHRPDSDWDLGVYYRGGPDLDALRRLAAEVTGKDVEIAAPGGWGPWVNGGAWLTVGEAHVDWIWRDLDRVEEVWAQCREGRYEVGIQAGHPLGFWSPAYVGEVALGRVLADPGGELAALRRTIDYPGPLRDALMAAGLWEAEFCLSTARKSARAGDVLHVVLSLSRAVGLLCQALHAGHRAWCLNEKGALPAAAALPGAPGDFRVRAEALLAAPGRTPADLAATLDAADAVVASVRTALATG
ncbi:nucleotidyltransferase domain-containing protein [Streptomyces sp. NPDC048639]|uniref:nucleotidyltransferase domain-containing protein n=1 Tax=Streptomyces sp. NPDC048639 TaxID=3365581 RepID=UPI00371304FD